MNIQNNGSHKNGFTLIEFLLYIALTSIMVAVLGGIGLHVLGSRAKAHAQVELQYSTEFAMERLSSLIASAESVSTPVAGETGDTLTLNFADASLHPTIIFVENGALYVQQGAEEQKLLANADVYVSAHSFTNVTRDGGTGSVRAFLQFSIEGAGNRNAETASMSVYTTMSIEQIP